MYCNFCRFLAVLVLFVGVGHAQEPNRTSIQVRNKIKYVERESGPLHLDLYLPSTRDQAYSPGLLVIHGGAWCAGHRLELSFHARKLAEAGYVAACIDYRLAPRHKFPAQLDDCRDALRWLASQSDQIGLDRNRIGLFGYSAGGHLACLLGLSPRTANEPRIGAIVAGGAPCDFRVVPPDTRMLDYWLGGSRLERPSAYDRASPASYLSADDPPTFLYGGEKDWLVPPFSAQFLAQGLSERGVSAEFFLCRNQGHVAALMNPDALRRAISFLDLHLRGDDGGS